MRQIQSRKEVEKNKCGICGVGSNEEEDSEEYEAEDEEGTYETQPDGEMETVEWVECEQCKQWFHCSCMELDPLDQEQVRYFRCGCISE